MDGRWHGYDLTWADDTDPAQLTIAVPGTRSRRVVDAAVAEARHVLGLDLDVTAFYRAAAADPVLTGLIARLRGLRPTLSPRPFEMLVGSVCAQQVNLAFAFTVRARLVRRFGVPVEVAGGTVYAFPEPAALARAAVEELRAMQFTVRKAEYIIGLAQEVAASRLDLDALGGRSQRGGHRDADEGARLRPLDGGVVSRAGPRPWRRLSCRRSRRAPGVRALLQSGTSAVRARHPPARVQVGRTPEHGDPLSLGRGSGSPRRAPGAAS